jgi:putative PIN family toxin of toxin-antitoxin system
MYVFDTCVWVAALRSQQGASFLIFQALQQRLLQGFISVPLLFEYEEVLRRDQQLANFWVALDELEIILGILTDRLQPSTINFRWRPQLRDPKDEMVLECAANAGAKAMVSDRPEVIVTFNQRDFLPAATTFGLEVIPPKALLVRHDLRKRLNYE